MASTPRRIFDFLRSHLQRLFRRREDEPVLRAIETLDRVSILDDLAWHNRRDIAHAIHYRTYRPDEVIYYQDDPGLGLYIVEDGTVELLAEEEDEEHLVRTVQDCAVFGAYSLLGDVPRLETARARTEVTVLGFFRPDLRTLGKRHPRTALLLVSALAEELARAHGRLGHSLSRLESHTRLLEILHETESAPTDSAIESPVESTVDTSVDS